MLIRILVLVFCITLVGCNTIPVSDVEPGEKPDSRSDVGGLWYTASKLEEQIKYSPKRVKDTEMENYFEQLTCRISPEYCNDIRVYIMDNPYFNAFMMPNGVMVIWTGLLLRAQSENQIAFVLAHEIGHYVKQHSIQSYRSLKNTENFLLIAIAVAPAASILGSFAAAGSLLKYSRDLEREADLYSIQTLLRLGFNPGSGAELFQLLEQEAKAGGKNSYNAFFATHPSDAERIKYISDHNNITEFNLNNSEQLMSIKTRYLDSWLDKEVSKRTYSSTEVLLERMRKDALDGTIEASFIDYYIGELYRKRGQDDDYKNAIVAYQDHITSEYQKPDAYKSVAELQEKTGNYIESIINLELYLENNPDAHDTSFIKQKIAILKARDT